MDKDSKNKVKREVGDFVSSLNIKGFKFKDIPKNIFSKNFEKSLLKGFSDSEKNIYFNEIKPYVSDFISYLRDETSFESMGEIAFRELKKGNRPLTEDENVIFEKIEFLVNKQHFIINSLDTLKNSEEIPNDQKIYFLVNIYRTIAEIFRGPLYEIVSHTSSFLNSSKNREHILFNKFKKDNLSIGENIEIIEIFEKKKGLKRAFSNVLRNFIDLDLRNYIAHEKDFIRDNKFISCDGVYNLFFKEIVDFVMKVVLVNVSLLYCVYLEPLSR